MRNNGFVKVQLLASYPCLFTSAFVTYSTNMVEGLVKLMVEGLVKLMVEGLVKLITCNNVPRHCVDMYRSSTFLDKLGSVAKTA